MITYREMVVRQDRLCTLKTVNSDYLVQGPGLTASSPEVSLSSATDFSNATIPSLTSSVLSLVTEDHHEPFSAQAASSGTSSPSRSFVFKKDALPSPCLTALVPLEDEAVGAISDVRPFARWGCGTWTNDEFEADVAVPSFDEDEPAPLSVGGPDVFGAVVPGDRLM